MAVQQPLPTESITVEGTAGTNDNDVIYDSISVGNDISRFDCLLVQCTAGTVDVDATLDESGVTRIAAVAGRDLQSTTPNTYVVDIATGKGIEIRGRYKRIQVLQKGATASDAIINHSRSSS